MTPMAPVSENEAGRFVLLTRGTQHFAESYVTSFDTWEEAGVAFDPLMPQGFYLFDQETGREWLPGARYEWEDART